MEQGRAKSPSRRSSGRDPAATFAAGGREMGGEQHGGVAHSHRLRLANLEMHGLAIGGALVAALPAEAGLTPSLDFLLQTPAFEKNDMTTQQAAVHPPRLAAPHGRPGASARGRHTA